MLNLKIKQEAPYAGTIFSEEEMPVVKQGLKLVAEQQREFQEKQQDEEYKKEYKTFAAKAVKV
ncbi:hypothetical protein [Methanobrevibacter sp. UBA417]|jgi:hypothetical protein|uniref:hypothetical protein n=1 Tax=Methanobrevibacter sp. UBA417 TaxID=1915487 RepID=UPI0039B8CBD7